MEIITYCSKNYEKVLKKMISSWKDSCSRVVIYTDSKLEIDSEQVMLSKFEETNWKRNTIKKIEAIRLHAKKNVDFTFLDSDCFVGENFNEVFSEDFSFGITGDEFAINSGVIFVKSKCDSSKLIEEWLLRSTSFNDLHSEQKSLQEMYKDNFCMKMFPKKKYNCYVGFEDNFCRETDKKAWIRLLKSRPKIVHFQGAGHFERFNNLQKLIDIYKRNVKEFI